MAKDLPTIWELKPHTAAKHAILRRYLQAWIPILGRSHGRVVYIDGFAGPGVYAGGEDGSPIIALKCAIEHAHRIASEMSFLFIEEDNDRMQSLEQSIQLLKLPSTFQLSIQLGLCEETINGLLDELDRGGHRLAPTFAFLDPFGFSHTSLALIKRLMNHRSCEVLITFMYEEINRFISQNQMPPHFDALFGCSEWAGASQIENSDQRRDFLRDLYRRQLEVGAGITFVRSFEMRNLFNRPDYFLFFGTKNVEGLRKMKEAMWKVDASGGFRFSDATDPNQFVLFEEGPDYGELRRRLVDEFRGRPISIEALERFVITQTPYRETHLRGPVLVPMEKADPPELEVISAPPGRKRSSFPSGTILRLR